MSTPQRLFVVKEIVSTEESYAKALQVIIDLYIEPLKKNGLITSEDMKTLFCNVRELYDGAVELTKQLKERLANFALNDNICDKEIFERFGPYIQNYDKASLLYDKLQKKKKFEDFCENAKENPLSCDGDIMSFLIAPVQRIPRYILLMREYTKNTEKDHPDAVIAEQVRRYLDSYAKQVNAVIARENNKQTMRDIAKRFTDLDPVVKEELIKTPHVLKQEGIDISFCFPMPLLYMVRKKVKKITFHQRLELTSVKNVEDTGSNKFGFQLKAPQKSVVVYAETMQIKKDWVMDLNESFTGERTYEFEQDISEEEAAPVWVPDDNVEDCMNCHDKFTVFNRRHHCRSCGRVLCGMCTKKKVIIPHLSSKPQRVCAKCASDFDNKLPSDSSTDDGRDSEVLTQPPELPSNPPPQRKQKIKVSALTDITRPTRSPPLPPY
ncbi:Rho guanine nucleotide exchange factor [Entamoeba marina]